MGESEVFDEGGDDGVATDEFVIPGVGRFFGVGANVGQRADHETEVATNKFANKPTKKNIPLSTLSNRTVAWEELKRRQDVTCYSA